MGWNVKFVILLILRPIAFIVIGSDLGVKLLVNWLLIIASARSLAGIGYIMYRNHWVMIVRLVHLVTFW